MRCKNVFILVALCVAVGFFSCSKEEKKVEAPKQRQIEKNLVPPKVEIKGRAFFAQLTDLKVAMTVDTASKEITETPSLKGNIKITNISKDMLDIQGVTLEYLDEAGRPIAFSSGEKVSKASPFWKTLKPEEVTEGTLEATIPRKAVKDKTLGKIEINLVYIPAPLRRETLTLSEKISP